MPELAAVLTTNSLKSKSDLQSSATKILEDLDKKSDVQGAKNWTPIITAMEDFFDKKGPGAVIAAIRTALGGANKQFFVKNPHKALLGKMIDTVDASLIGAVTENQGTIDEGMKKTFSMALRKALFEVSKFACGDALAFSGAINDAGTGYYAPKQVLNREWRRKNQDGSPSTITDAKLAVCTTFALEAKNIIEAKRTKSIKRVEIVAVTNHVFCLVNRKAGSDITDIDDYGWDEACYVVDLWLGSLGHLYFYQEDKYSFLASIQDIHYDKSLVL